jgi:hypothetical protein
LLVQDVLYSSRAYTQPMGYSSLRQNNSRGTVRLYHSLEVNLTIANNASTANRPDSEYMSSVWTDRAFSKYCHA